jgi:SAM-dependent methyltransferase
VWPQVVNKMSDPVAEFWNREAAAFTAGDGLRRSYHLEFGQMLNTALSGDVLCVGGLYEQVDLGSGRFSVTIVDVSEKMLSVYESRGARVLLGDARSLPVPSASVDHVVFPLVLHHITGRSAHESRENVLSSFREALRVLRPGGVVWAKEILVSEVIYQAELALAPITRTLLATRRIPLVIFHSWPFYRSRLHAAGFSDVSLTRSDARQDRWYDLVRPVIGLGLCVPRIMVPVRYGLLRGVKPMLEESPGREPAL